MSTNPRQLYEVFGADPTCLSPLGVVVDGTLFAYGLTALDPHTGDMPEGLDAQLLACLERMQELVTQAGASLASVARGTCYVTSPDDREGVYRQWEALFPDPADKPAFKVLIAELPAGQRARLDVIAVPGATRRRIDLPNVEARDPTVAIGDWLFTSRLHALAPETGQQVAGVEAQARQAVANVRALLAAGGFQMSDLAQLQIFGNNLSYADVAGGTLKDGAGSGTLNTLVSWVRPGTELMLEATALRPDALANQRQFRELYLCSEHSNVAAGFMLGSLVFAPDVGPADPCAGATIDGVEEQIRAALENMDRLLEVAGCTRSEVARVTFFMRDLGERETLNTVWQEWYPNSEDRPPHTYLPATLPDGQHVSLQIIGVAGGARRVLKVPGIEHGDPMSLAAVTGNLLFSSRIFANVRGDGAEILDQHTASCYSTADALLTSAGTDWLSLNQLTVYVSSPDFRGSVQQGLATRTTNDSSRVAFLETDLGRRTLLPRLQLTAVLPDNP